ncbi:Phosphoinositide 3-kinase adapter protein 1 [Galemys pyrenaicus]|uniref:Phosphoinositide 3-kinase adapter protein 1 n=1 Tax=Galemys pyrenaicus TaxID=202257 RepID=A0A8J6ALF8_GALPY|nr:Phosphoinositide 3-kinase adapter protein 1 [Galemys pyrenaicus]
MTPNSHPWDMIQQMLNKEKYKPIERGSGQKGPLSPLLRGSILWIHYMGAQNPKGTVLFDQLQELTKYRARASSPQADRGNARGAKPPASSLPPPGRGAGVALGAGLPPGTQRGFSLPLPNGRSRCRGPSPAGGAGGVDTPPWPVLAAAREEAPERLLVLRGARRPPRPAPRDAAGPRLRAPGTARPAIGACERRPGMAASEMLRGCDILIVYSQDAREWCEYLQSLFLSSRQVQSQKTLTYRLGPEVSFSATDLSFFLSARCIVVLLSAEMVQQFCQPTLLPLLQRAFHPPHRVVRLLCGVQDSEDFLDFFPDWAHWQELTCDDEPETYVTAVKKVISEVTAVSKAGSYLNQLSQGHESGSLSEPVPPMDTQDTGQTWGPEASSESSKDCYQEHYQSQMYSETGQPQESAAATEYLDGQAARMGQFSFLLFPFSGVLCSVDSGCDSVTDTETEDEKVFPYSKQQSLSTEISPGNLMVVQPDRIRCGAETTVYVIVRCQLDERVTTEAEFSPEDSPSIRVEAKLENEYTVSVKAPNLSSGTVSLRIYSGDLVVCETVISYYTDMEEIGNLLSNAANPVEFMCQAFKIVPYNTETLDKLLTESLKNNIPASGLHLFGINQLEEEDMMTNQRDEELPTLLHFAAKYGLKNLTALLLTCPGALQAYSVANKHGHYPNTIAEKHGFRDLRQFIDEYVETVDMLKSHIKEELMQGEETDAVYESMAHLSTDLLMKCSLNPGCDEELYESMAAFAPAATEDLYVEMLQTSSPSPRDFSRTTKDSMIRKFLEGNSMGTASSERELHHVRQEKDSYHTVEDDETFSVDLANRPPIPVPRPDTSVPGAHQLPDNEPYISKVFAEKSQERPGNIYVSSESFKKEPPVRPWRDRPQSSIYDPFAGMKTPGQRQLITLQEQVKLGIVNVDEAVLHFKEWQLNQKKRSESFRFQQKETQTPRGCNSGVYFKNKLNFFQENLKRLRDSITRRQKEKQKSGKQPDLEITVPIRHSQLLPGKVEFGVYESGPRKSVFPPRTELRRGDWKTDSTSSTASSASNRSSTRSLLSVSSGMEGDNEDNEVPEVTRSRSPGPLQVDGAPAVPLERPPRVPPRAASQR